MEFVRPVLGRDDGVVVLACRGPRPILVVDVCCGQSDHRKPPCQHGAGLSRTTNRRGAPSCRTLSILFVWCSSHHSTISRPHPTQSTLTYTHAVAFFLEILARLFSCCIQVWPARVARSLAVQWKAHARTHAWVNDIISVTATPAEPNVVSHTIKWKLVKTPQFIIILSEVTYDLTCNYIV